MQQPTPAFSAAGTDSIARVAARTSILVAGGGGPLGSEVLTQLLASTHFSTVQVLATCELRSALRGLKATVQPSWDERPATRPAPPPSSVDTPITAHTGLVIFDNPRHVNGRGNAFAQPLPSALPLLARWLRQQGVRHLLVVQPHDSALLPQALSVGLANLDEQAVTSMDFDHVMFVRATQAPRRGASAHGLQRLANILLSQLRTVMLAPANRPVRARDVAAVVAELATKLPGTPPGSRVLGCDWS